MKKMVAMNNNSDWSRKQNDDSVRSKPEQEQRVEEVDLDASLQAKYRKAYFEQLRRRSCDGCGESDWLDAEKN